MAIAMVTERLTHSSLGGVGTNSWHMRWDGAFAGGAAIAQDLVNVIKDFRNASQSLQPDTLDIDFDGEVQGLGPDLGSTLTIASHTQNGSTAGGVTAPALALCVSWKTSTGGRRGRGRTFFNPLVTGVMDANGTPTSAAMTTIRGAASGLVTDSEAVTGGALGVWSGLDSVLRDFIGSAVTDQFAVLRSRRD